MNTVVAADFQIPEPGKALEVAPGVHLLRMPLPFELDHINLFLLEDHDGWVIVDCGLLTSKTTSIWETIAHDYFDGMPVSKVIVTHSHIDHMGAAGWLSERFSAPLYITAREYDLACDFLNEVSSSYSGSQAAREAFCHRLGMSNNQTESLIGLNKSLIDLFGPPPADFNELKDDSVIEIGLKHWRVIVSEGHSIAHASLYCEELDILISGDQVLPRISSNVSVGPHEPDGNPLQSWLLSLNRMKNLSKTTLVLPAHNFPFFGIHKRLDELIKGHQQKLTRVEAACDEAVTIMQLVSQIHDRKLSLFDVLLASGECLAHVHYLIQKGRLFRVEQDDGVYRYQRYERSLGASVGAG